MSNELKWRPLSGGIAEYGHEPFTVLLFRSFKGQPRVITANSNQDAFYRERGWTHWMPADEFPWPGEEEE